MLGGFGTRQPLVPDLHCREGRLLLMQPRARRAGRKTAAREAGRASVGLAAPRVGWGYPRQRCQAQGLGAWRRCRQTLSASSLCRDGTGSTVGEPHSPHTLILPRKSHRSWGPLLHTRSPKRPVQGQGAVQAPTLPLPGCWAGQTRGGAVEPKGRAGALPITAHTGNLSLC